MKARMDRLTAKDRESARALFAMMAQVFGEPPPDLSDAYLHGLLARPDFWAIAATVAGKPVGGITAHALPMTRNETSELFIYDLAVRESQQRRGVGRELIAELRAQAAALGIRVLFVPVDNEDGHALDFYRAIGGAASPVTLFAFESPAPAAM